MEGSGVDDFAGQYPRKYEVTVNRIDVNDLSGSGVTAQDLRVQLRVPDACDDSRFAPQSGQVWISTGPAWWFSRAR
jgi:hypothetical protein